MRTGFFFFLKGHDSTGIMLDKQQGRELLGAEDSELSHTGTASTLI